MSIVHKMQPLPRYERPEPGRTEPTRPRARKSARELLRDVLAHVTSFRFWGGLSASVTLLSLALPWWGITVGLPAYSSSWGLFFGPQSQASVTWYQDRIDAILSGYYPIMTGLVLVTTLSTAFGTIFRRMSMLTVSIILSIITVLTFFAALGDALSHECDRIGGLSTPCISGLIGDGVTGMNLVTWGFQAGFYAFIASSILVLVAMGIPER